MGMSKRKDSSFQEVNSGFSRTQKPPTKKKKKRGGWKIGGESELNSLASRISHRELRGEKSARPRSNNVSQSYSDVFRCMRNKVRKETGGREGPQITRVRVRVSETVRRRERTLPPWWGRAIMKYLYLRHGWGGRERR